MKSWKDVPNLFANGKFEALNYFEEKKRYKIMGCSCDNKQFELEKGDPSKPFYERFNQNVEYCTLIARKIEDLSEDELKIHREKQICIPDMEGVYRFRETPESFLYALSVGCLPEMFEWDETVIDSKTL